MYIVATCTLIIQCVIRNYVEGYRIRCVIFVVNNYLCFFPFQGLPFPSQEFNAIDVVVRYAVTKLGFAFEDIVLYAWSIGK